MTAPLDGCRLGEWLRDLADQVHPADLHDGAVHRSGRIARREVMVGTGAALLALALLTSGLWQLPEERTPPAPVVADHSSAPATPAMFRLPDAAETTAVRAPAKPAGTVSVVPQLRPAPPEVAETTATPRSRVLADLPGHVFYQRTGVRAGVIRLSPGDGRTETAPAGVPASAGDADAEYVASIAGGTLTVDRTVTGAITTRAFTSGERVEVAGRVVGAAFDPDGHLLVRTVRQGQTRLWLFAPDDTLLVRADEPAELRTLALLAYTR